MIGRPTIVSLLSTSMDGSRRSRLSEDSLGHQPSRWNYSTAVLGPASRHSTRYVLHGAHRFAGRGCGTDRAAGDKRGGLGVACAVCLAR